MSSDNWSNAVINGKCKNPGDFHGDVQSPSVRVHVASKRSLSISDTQSVYRCRCTPILLARVYRCHQPPARVRAVEVARLNRQCVHGRRAGGVRRPLNDFNPSHRRLTSGPRAPRRGPWLCVPAGLPGLEWFAEGCRNKLHAGLKAVILIELDYLPI